MWELLLSTLLIFIFQRFPPTLHQHIISPNIHTTPLSRSHTTTPNSNTPFVCCITRLSTEQIFQPLSIGPTDFSLPERPAEHEHYLFADSTSAGAGLERWMYSVAVQECMTPAEAVPIDRRRLPQGSWPRPLWPRGARGKRTRRKWIFQPVILYSASHTKANYRTKRKRMKSLERTRIKYISLALSAEDCELVVLLGEPYCGVTLRSVSVGTHFWPYLWETTTKRQQPKSKTRWTNFLLATLSSDVGFGYAREGESTSVERRNKPHPPPPSSTHKPHSQEKGPQG